jgi:signal transduction histidine kinase
LHYATPAKELLTSNHLEMRWAHEPDRIVAIFNSWLRFVMATFFDLSSLRGKISSAYIALVVITAMLGIIAFSDLLFLERQVTEGEVVSDLKDAILEMRREEKNLFLNKNTATFSRADKHAALSLGILQEYQSVLGAIMPGSDPLNMAKTLNTYRTKLRYWNSASSGERKTVQAEIRTLGHQLYLSVESLSKQERRMLETAVQKSQWFLLISLFLIGLSIYMLGRKLRRVAVTPLKQLESRLMPIAEGRFNHLDPPSSDREFITFTDAFNRMLKELEIRQKRMLQSEKLASLGILASGVAHELNNPLSNISSSCQLLMEELTEADPAQLDTWLKQIDSETERGRNIVRTLLDFGSQRIFQKRQLKLLDLFNETQIIIAKTLRQNSAKLTINVPNDLILNADKQRIQQLFINLIQNALHAGGQGVEVQISAMLGDRAGSLIPDNAEVAGNLKCITDYNGRFIEILVADNGPGIPSENLSKVFDPFFTTSGPGPSVGLGLFIVQEIVSEHDGCLAIASQLGKGTKVIVLLPDKESNRE